MGLDERKGKILQAVVNDYVETADPVGSEWLAAHYDFGCKSATLRNEMAEMAVLGYLLQPHTSAGRIPTGRGYRYYVDRLMVVNPPVDSIDRNPLPAERAETPAEEIVQEACRLLSEITRYPSAATPPTVNATRLHRLYLAPATPERILLVMLLSTGHVENRLIELGYAPSPGSLERITNYLNQEFAGCELGELVRHATSDLSPELMPDRALLGKVRQIVQSASRSLADRRVFLEGAGHIIREREFQDVARLEQMLALLDQQNLLFDALSQAILAEQVTVVIGDEVPVSAMRDCSVVASQYRIGGRTGGFIGVVGPTRMRYDRAVGAVGLMARNLSTVLTRASLG